MSVPLFSVLFTPSSPTPPSSSLISRWVRILNLARRKKDYMVLFLSWLVTMNHWHSTGNLTLLCVARTEDDAALYGFAFGFNN